MAPSYSKIISSAQGQHNSDSENSLQAIELASESTSLSPPTSSNDAAVYPQSLSTPCLSLPTSSSRGPHWILEYVSLIMSWITIIALVVFVAKIDGMKLSSWTAPVSPNTVVSILAAIARTTLGFAISSCIGQNKWNWFRKRSDSVLAFDRFDDASRGPWGSFWLIIWVKACHWVAIGAAVVVALLAFEPFMQAVLFVDGRIDIVSDAGEARIGRSELLEAGFVSFETGVSQHLELPENNKIVDLFHIQTSQDYRMVFIFNNVFTDFLDAQKRAPSYSCSTTNCTWGISTSLAVCSACNDVSDHIKNTVVNRSYPAETPRRQIYQPSYSAYPEQITLDRLLPYLMGGSAPPGTKFTKSELKSLISATPLKDASQTISFRNMSTMITTVAVFQAADDDGQDEILWDTMPLMGTECALYFCVKASSISVENGAMYETTVASWANRDFTSYASSASVPNIELWDKYQNYSLYPAKGEGGQFVDIFRNDLVLTVPPEDIKLLGLLHNTTIKFNITQNTISSMVTWIGDFFPGEMGGAGPVGGMIMQNQNLTAIFNQVATSLSGWIRDKSNVTESGATNQWLVHIKVQWAYIILPLSALILGSAFCLISILETRALGFEAWKTDTIATLTYSVDPDTRTQLRQACGKGNLAKVARAINVRLEDADGGFELRAK